MQEQRRLISACGAGIFLADPLDERLRREVLALETNTDEFCVHGREIYWLRRKKQAGAGFSNVPLEKTLAKPFTIHGGGTVKKMALKSVECPYTLRFCAQ